MLKQRIITAVLIVAGLLLALVYLPPLMLSLLFAGLLTLAAWEWSNLAGLQSFTTRLLYCAVCISGMVAAAWYSRLFSDDIHEAFIKEILRLACLWWALALLWVKSYPASASLWGSVPVRCVMGLLVLLPTWLAISYLRQLEQGVLLILMVIALVAAADIGAYFAGRRWGQAKLAPSVSPGKSWAGFWGGLSSAILLAMALWWLWPGGMPLDWLVLLPLAAVTVLASVLGDLQESMIKRHRGIKDSGSILPGHGGVMDRLDSLTAAIPVFTLSLMLVGW